MFAATGTSKGQLRQLLVPSFLHPVKKVWHGWATLYSGTGTGNRGQHSTLKVFFCVLGWGWVGWVTWVLVSIRHQASGWCL